MLTLLLMLVVVLVGFRWRLDGWVSSPYRHSTGQ